MADISITAANVVPGPDAVTVIGTSGATITAGQVVYYDTTTSTWKLADANGATALIREGSGIALCAASSGQKIVVQTGGSLTLGGPLTAGSPYYVSATPGGVAPAADLTTGWEVTLLGLASSTTVLKMAATGPLRSGVTL
jgi:hypothetical protein